MANLSYIKSISDLKTTFYDFYIKLRKSLEEGDEVEFEITDGPRGPMATAITKMG